MRAGMLALAFGAIILELVAFRLTGLADAVDWRTNETVAGYVCQPAAPTAGGQLAFGFCPLDEELDALTGWRGGVIRVITDDPSNRDHWSGAMQLTLVLSPPVAPLNAGGGGYERWLFKERIVASARLEAATALPASCGWRCRYHQWRIGLIARLEQHLQRMQHPELVEALLLGSRARLTDSDWGLLSATGTQHLVAISGLHLGLVAFCLIQLLTPLSVALSPNRPVLSRWLPLALIAPGVFGYALLAGFTVPTQRALVMVLVAGAIALSGRQWRLWDALLIAMLAVVLMEPRAVCGMGFWFSFGAVACLMLAFGGRHRKPQKLKSLVVAQVAVVAGLVPVVSAFALSSSLAALPANLIAIPLLSVIVLPLVLLAAPLILWSPATAQWVEPGLDLVTTAFWALLRVLASFEHSIAIQSAVTLALLGVGVFVAVGPSGWLYRSAWAGAVLMVLGVSEPEHSSQKAVRSLRFPDGVGGPMALIRHPEATILFDARALDGRYRAISRDRVLPWLKELGVKRLDAVVLSHPGVDVQKHWNLDRLPGIEQWVTADECTEVRHSEDAGLILTGWQDSRGDTLSVPEQSCNLLVEQPGVQTLLFGPIQRSGERRLLQWLDEPKRIDLVLAPRGGEGRSSQLGMIERLQPQWAVISPSSWRPFETAAAESRYRKAGTVVRGTASDGEVAFFIEDGVVRMNWARRNRLLLPDF